MKREARSDRRRSGPRVTDGTLVLLLGAAMGSIGAGACGDSTPPSAPTVSFRSPTAKVYADGHLVQALDVGDVDGDGHLDVVLNDANQIATLRGDGTGSLGPDLIAGGTTFSNGIVTADVTGDGRADLIGGGGLSGNIRIFPGRADGTFGPSIAYGIPAQFVSRFLVADMTGDGKPDVLLQASDILVTGFGGTFLAVLPNLGNGVLGEGLLTPLEYDPQRLAVADVNGDGAMDVAILDRDTLGTRLLLNDGRGNLGVPQPTAAGPLGNGPLVAGDIDNDGRTDLFRIVGNNNQLLVMRNLGGGTFQPLPMTNLETFASDLLAADLNGDGRTDVAALVANGAVTVLHSDGSTLKAVATYATGGSADQLRTGDFNQDGFLDLIVTNSTSNGNNLAMLINDGHGLFDATPMYPGPGGAWTLTLGDVTGDGLADVVMSAADSDGEATLVIVESTRKGKPRAQARLIPIPGDGFPVTTVLIGDVNHDGIADVVAAEQVSTAASVLFGNGGGQLGGPRSVDLGSGGKIALGDLDGDAFMDLAVGPIDPAGDIRLLSNKGDGSFRPLKTYHAGEGSAAALLITDLDADGRSDVVSVLPSFNGTGTISLLRRSGLDQFAEPQILTVVPTPDTLVAADFDRNGRLDLVGSTVLSLEVPLLFAASSGQAFTRTAIDVGGETAGAASADFNRDGWPDLAFANATNGDIVVLLNDRHGGFAERVTIPLRLEPRALGAADLDGDGKVDLAVLTIAGTIVLWNTSE